MKITKVILSCNNNPKYLPFWPIISKIWKLRFEIDPILYFIDDTEETGDEVVIDETYGKVIRFKAIKSIPTSYQSQAIRLLVPALYPNDTLIISDIDMIPIDVYYFTKSIKHVNEHFFVMFTHFFQMCYNVATGKVWSEIFNINSIEEVRERLECWFNNNSNRIWTLDQQMLRKYIKQWESKAPRCYRLFNHISGIHPSYKVINRLSRKWKYFTMDLKMEELDKYIDYAIPQNYIKYKEHFDKVCNYLIETK